MQNRFKDRKEPQTEEEIRSYIKRYDMLDWFEALITAGIFAMVIFIFFVQIVIVDGNSMNPTLLDKERLLTVPCYTELEYQDIVVIRRDDGQPIIKRVIATEHQEVDIDVEAGTVSVDGKVLDEPYIAGKTNSDGGEKSIGFPITVPEDCIFVMGDNREFSLDSRYQEIGMVPVDHVFGKVWIRFFPFTEFGKIETKIK